MRKWAPQTCYGLWRNKGSITKDLIWFDVLLPVFSSADQQEA